MIYRCIDCLKKVTVIDATENFYAPGTKILKHEHMFSKDAERSFEGQIRPSSNWDDKDYDYTQRPYWSCWHANVHHPDRCIRYYEALD